MSVGLLLCDFFIRLFFISLPEEYFILGFALVLSRHYRYFEKGNRIRLVMLALIPSIVLNITRAAKLNDTINLVLCLVMMAVIIQMITRQKLIKSILCALVPYIIFMATEILGVCIVIYSTGLSTKAISDTVFIAFPCTLLERLFQYSILFINLIGNIGKGEESEDTRVGGSDIIEYILSSKGLRKSTFCILLIDIIFLGVFGYLLMILKILAGLPVSLQLFACLLVFLVPFATFYFVLDSAHKSLVNGKAYSKQTAIDVKAKIEEALENAKKGGADEKTIRAIKEIAKTIEFL